MPGDALRALSLRSAATLMGAMDGPGGRAQWPCDEAAGGAAEAGAAPPRPASFFLFFLAGLCCVPFALCYSCGLASGGVAEWLKAADCKSARIAYAGSNPASSTKICVP